MHIRVRRFPLGHAPPQWHLGRSAIERRLHARKFAGILERAILGAIMSGVLFDDEQCGRSPTYPQASDLIK